MQALLFGFRGRFNRARFWLVHVGVSVAAAALLAVAFVTSGRPAGGEGAGTVRSTTAVGVAPLCIPLVWIGLAASVKRWHDCGKSGWWMLVTFVPVVGGLWYLIECGFLPGTPGPNIYGPDPLASL